MSSSDGGGKGFFDNLGSVASVGNGGNFFENLFSDIANLGVQSGTMGVLGYKDGKIDNGVNTNIAKSAGKAVVSGLKEVTGAKAAEDANKMARQQFEQTQAESEAARLESQKQTAKSQMQQSLTAGAARNATSTSRSANKGTPIGGVSLGQDEKTFLGL